MDTGQVVDRGCNSRRAVDGGARRRDGACDGILAAVVIAVLFALTLWIAAALPRAVEAAANVAILPSLESDAGRPYPRDIDEEHPEPPLADAARREGPMSA